MLKQILADDNYALHSGARAADLTPVDQYQAGAKELADEMDRLVDITLRQTPYWHFPSLVQLLDRVKKVNPHQHLTGSIGDREILKLVIQCYRNDFDAREMFLNYALERQFIDKSERNRFFQKPDHELLAWFERQIPLQNSPRDFREADDRLSLSRMAFQSQHECSQELLRKAYRIVALENSAHGVSEVWFRTTLGDHEDESFGPAVQAALDGARQAELESGESLNVRFLVGARKEPPCGFVASGTSGGDDTKSVSLVWSLDNLRKEGNGLENMLAGIDSVGTDANWRPEWQAQARRIASECNLHVAAHFAESWHEGYLIQTLESLETLVRDRFIDHLDNANALFAMRDLRCDTSLYTDSEWANIRNYQHHIFCLLKERGIFLGINPTSNDWLTRSLRQREGWRFRELNEPFGNGIGSVADMVLRNQSGSKILGIVVGNDNSRIYPSQVPGAYLTVSEELASLWGAPGSSSTCVYGKLPSVAIAQLILNGFTLVTSANGSQGPISGGVVQTLANVDPSCQLHLAPLGVQ